MNKWHRTLDLLPPDGTLVEVVTNGGCTLLYRGGMWWIPDGSMYVYYVPEYWREV